MPFAPLVLLKRSDSTRLLLLNCTEKFLKHLKQRQHHFTLAAHMLLPKFMDIGSQSITERLTICLPATEFCSIMKSPRRGITFVTRKIARAVARISKGKDKELRLGNINALRDWGHAKDYVEGMWLILQHNTPMDFVLATGEQHSVREFCEICFKFIGITIKWKGKDVDEIGYDESDESRELIKIDPRYFRPTEVETLLGNPKLAEETLGWKRNYSFKALVDEMMKHEMSLPEDSTE